MPHHTARPGLIRCVLAETIKFALLLLTWCALITIAFVYVV